MALPPAVTLPLDLYSVGWKFGEALSVFLASSAWAVAIQAATTAAARRRRFIRENVRLSDEGESVWWNHIGQSAPGNLA
jgi:hypothetical protein